MKYKQIENNVIVAIGEMKTIGIRQTEITEDEYNNILSVICNKPDDTDTIIYKLNAETLEYEPYDRPEDSTPAEPENPYGIDDETYNAIIDDYTMQLIEEGTIT